MKHPATTSPVFCRPGDGVSGAVPSTIPLRRPAPAPATQPPAYPAELMHDARRRWDATGAERACVARCWLEARTLDCETPARLLAYARRLLIQVAGPHSGPTTTLAADLKAVVGLLDDHPARPGNDRPPRAAFIERVFGEAEETLAARAARHAARAIRPVGRLTHGTAGRDLGTGFLIAPGVLMTTLHVLRDPQTAAQATVRLDTHAPRGDRPRGPVFRLQPDRLFHGDAGLDLALVAVAPTGDDGTALDGMGHLPLIGGDGKIRKAQPVTIVQPRQAGHSHAVTRDTLLTALPEAQDHIAHYTGDTRPGASGAPVFSERWEVVAMHRLGVPDCDGAGHPLAVDGTRWDELDDPAGRTLSWVGNEGIRVSRILHHLDILPVRMIAEGKPGAALVQSVLDISRAATRSGGPVPGLAAVPSVPGARGPCPHVPGSPHAPDATPAGRIVALRTRMSADIDPTATPRRGSAR